MAKTRAKTTTKEAAKLAGKTVAFVGKFGYKNSKLDSLKSIAELEGGKVVDIGSTIPDYLITGSGSKPLPGLTKILKNHPEMQVLDEASLIQMTAPTAEDFLTILRSGPHSFDFWCGLQHRIPNAVDLSETFLRYKGAEAGEVDWRPTETIPEDFYAM